MAFVTRFFNKLSDWYFRKASLPYWCVLVLDCLIVLLSNLIVYSLNYGLVLAANEFWSLMGTLCIYLLFYLVGFKVMHTYSGIVRYSSFLDLLRIGCAMLISITLALIVRYVFQLDDVLCIIGGRVLVEGFVLATTQMWLVRIIVKFMYDMFFSSTRQKNAFIYGDREGAVGLAKSICNSKPTRFRLRGFITSNEKMAGRELMAKTIYMLDDGLIDRLIEKHIEVVLVSPLKNAEFRENIAFQMRLLEAGIKIFMMPELVEWDGKSDLAHTQLKEVEIEDLLPRAQIDVNMKAIGALLTGKTILITGSAGSIGSEMVRQVAAFKPKRMILIDQAETPQHDIRLMMQGQWPEQEAHTIVTSICNETRMETLFREYRPEYVFHAAAYKHVPMMEDNPCEAIQNNVRGTQILARLAVKYGVKKFVMISTDKAVNPTNVMGCSKRICEIDVQSIDSAIKQYNADLAAGKKPVCPFELAEGVERPVTQFVTTRFGNVLGSNGSVLLLFKKQIQQGGPITVTHPDIIRFFMLIPEACKLVLEAGTMGNGGEIFVFDMGKPVRIVDLAKRMIRLSGAQNIEIKFTGLRDGEKLYEEVLADKERTKSTVHPKIMVASVRQSDYNTVVEQMQRLYQASFTYNDMEVVKIMKEMVPEFKSQNSKYQVLDGGE